MRFSQISALTENRRGKEGTWMAYKAKGGFGPGWSFSVLVLASYKFFRLIFLKIILLNAKTKTENDHPGPNPLQGHSHIPSVFFFDFEHLTQTDFLV